MYFSLGYGLIGITIAIIIDEWFRGSLMFVRWRSKKWKEKILVQEVKTERKLKEG